MMSKLLFNWEGHSLAVTLGTMTAYGLYVRGAMIV